MTLLVLIIIAVIVIFIVLMTVWYSTNSDTNASSVLVIPIVPTVSTVSEVPTISEDIEIPKIKIEQEVILSAQPVKTINQAVVTQVQAEQPIVIQSVQAVEPIESIVTQVNLAVFKDDKKIDLGKQEIVTMISGSNVDTDGYRTGCSKSFNVLSQSTSTIEDPITIDASKFLR